MKKSAFYLLLGTVALFLLQTANRPRSQDVRLHPLVIETGDDDFAERVRGAGEWVLIDFWAPWCGTCTRLKPELNAIIPLYENDITFLAMNVDKTPRTKDFFGVYGIPALILMRNGREVARWSGYANRNVLRDWLDGLLQRR